MIYADTSALAKLLVSEAESAALRSWLALRADEPVATSVIGEVELRRVALRLGDPAPARAEQLLARVDRVTLTPATAVVAGRTGPPGLRTLDAVHVATALLLPGLTALLTYDQRMADAGSNLGLPVVSPT